VHWNAHDDDQLRLGLSRELFAANFYFPVTTTYAIPGGHNGVPLGKFDFVRPPA